MNEIVKIEKLDHYGRGIGYQNDKIVFVADALVKEAVTLRDICVYKKRIRAVSKGIQNVSPNRVKPICPYYNRCGGCDIMHMDLLGQRLFKQQKVVEILKRYVNLDDFEIEFIRNENILYYRNKTTFQVDRSIGFYQTNSNDIVPVSRCMISNKGINDVLTILKQQDLTGLSQVIVRHSEYYAETMVLLKGEKSEYRELIDSLRDNIDSCYINHKHVFGQTYITEKIGEYIFQIGPDAFFQVNSVQVKQLYDKVLEYASLSLSDQLLDLYCGTGTIGIYLSKYCNKVVGIEKNETAIQNANQNKKINQVSNIEFFNGDVANILSNIANSFDVILVDPPRKGLDTKTIDYLLHQKAKRIVYVSCDPMTLARDLKLLQDIYEVKQVSLVDMFPNTHHVECVVMLIFNES